MRGIYVVSELMFMHSINMGLSCSYSLSLYLSLSSLSLFPSKIISNSLLPLSVSVSLTLLCITDTVELVDATQIC